MPTNLDAPIAGSALTPIALAKIKEMTDRYRSTMPENDAKSCWVSKTELLKLMDDNKANGIRIYYGRHADTDPDEFKSKHNVILVATIDSVNPDKPTLENSQDQLNEAIDNGPVNSVVAGFAGYGDDAIPLCPPHCPTGTSVLS